PAAQQQELADQALLEQLRARDREVRIHEAAHAAVGGRYAGSASFQYQRGPDGRNYAVGGEVGISTSPVPGDPQATIEKARTIRAAALAPAEPSAQDRRVAAEAAQMEVEARTELQAQTRQEQAAEEKARAEAADEQPVEEVITETQSDADTSAQTAPVFPPPVAQTSQSDSQPEEDSAQQQEKPRPNARERLEQLLLGTGSILQQANRQGLVDPQNPYGKSGYLDVIA
ncbi:MAG: putative metalloprotease CJM1_0395 family protein, partial [Gammaproteobacteria bacterium]